MPLDSMFSSVRRKVEREVRERMSSLAPAPLDQGSRSDSLPGSSQDAHPAAAAGGVVVGLPRLRYLNGY